MGKRICHKLGYYVTYWYTGTFHKDTIYRALCNDKRAAFGSFKWLSGTVDCPKCLKLRRKPSTQVAHAKA